jgi:hypothetical protein
MKQNHKNWRLYGAMIAAMLLGIGLGIAWPETAV